MKAIEPGNRANQRGSVVTIGNFDGVHRGHQQLIALAASHAEARHGELIVLTFDPHPRTILHPEQASCFLITTTAEKTQLLRRFGADRVEVLPFTPEFSSLSARDFLEQELVGRLHAETVVVGRNFSFGRGGEGDVAFLRHFGAQNDIAVIVADAFYDDHGMPISSSRIRASVAGGDLLEAERLLGRPFGVQGRVISGAGRGRRMGVPTANLAIGGDHLMPPLGVYAGFVGVGPKTTFPAVASWGIRPTFADLNEPLLEVHVIDVEIELAGRAITFAFTARIRPELRFANVDELMQQMAKDIDLARAWYRKRLALKGDASTKNVNKDVK